MMTYCNYKNLGDQFEMFTNIEPLCCVTGNIRVSQVNYTSKTNKQTSNKKIYNLYGNTKKPKWPKQSWGK